MVAPGGGSQVWERRRLNDEIEESVIAAAKASANIQMKLFSGKGNIQGDLQDFYNQFAYLYRLTSNLKEMDVKDDEDTLKKTKKTVSIWIGQKNPDMSTQQKMVEISTRGIELFDEYYSALGHRGLVTLPSRR